jgi:hypothetical protein
MKRFLGLSEEEIKENQKLWHEERVEPEEGDSSGSTGGDLRSVGISTGDINSDLETSETVGDGSIEGDMGDMGDMGGGQPLAPGGAAPAPTPPV